MAVVNQFTVKDPTTIRDDILRTYKNGMQQRGILNVQVGPNTELFLKATALANELAVINANCVISNDEQMPDTAGEDGVIRVADMLDLEAQPASPSIGPIILESSAPSPVTTGAQLTDSLGQRFEVVVGGVYNPGDPITVRCLTAGIDTNHAEGDVLQWASAPPFASDKALVGPGGLVNGSPAEDVEILRQRVMGRFQTPSGSGNWPQIAEDAEKSSARVDGAVVYPAVRGPSSVDVVVTAAPTSTSKNRDVSAIVVTGEVDPYVKGKHPGHAGIVTSTVVNTPVDVVIGLTIPDTETANPPGIGGGWLDATPWPRPDGTTVFRALITSVASTTQFTVDTVEAPQAGITHVSWVSPIDWKLYSGLIVAVSGTAGAWVVTVDEPFTGLLAGTPVFPSAERMQEYLDSVFQSFAEMGPGEKTSNVSALVRGFRHPPPQVRRPYAIDATMTRPLTADFDECTAAQFFWRSDGTTNLSGPSGRLVPQVPASFGPPLIFVPNTIAFYRIPT